MRTLRNAIAQDKVHHAYLFVGSRGTGKTSMAKILAASLNCVNGPTVTPCGECDSCVAIASATSLDVIEMDAASNNSVDDIRDLRENVAFAPVSGRHKVYILDEAHMLSTAAWNAFLKTLEEPPPHTIFVLATTEANKVLPTVVDRCHRFDFARPSVPQIAAVVRRVADTEAIEIGDEAAALVARSATGSFRDALGTLEQLVAYSGRSIALDDVLAVLGAADADLVFGAVDAVAAGDARAALLASARLAESGRDLGRFFGDLEAHARGADGRPGAGRGARRAARDAGAGRAAGGPGRSRRARRRRPAARDDRRRAARHEGRRRRADAARARAGEGGRAGPRSDREGAAVADRAARGARAAAARRPPGRAPPPARRAPPEPATPPPAARASPSRRRSRTSRPSPRRAPCPAPRRAAPRRPQAAAEQAAAAVSEELATEADPAPAVAAVAVVEPDARRPSRFAARAVGRRVRGALAGRHRVARGRLVPPGGDPREAGPAPRRSAAHAGLARVGLVLEAEGRGSREARAARPGDPGRDGRVAAARLRAARDDELAQQVAQLSEDELVERFKTEFSAEEEPPEEKLMPQPPNLQKMLRRRRR